MFGLCISLHLNYHQTPNLAANKWTLLTSCVGFLPPFMRTTAMELKIMADAIAPLASHAECRATMANTIKTQCRIRGVRPYWPLNGCVHIR
jgi:hypothetical protein